jgi:hypothetical protein
MESLHVKSTSRQHAACSDIIVRSGDTVRLVFRPEIVDNPKNPLASIRGTFVYQRKGKKDDWEDETKKSLSSLRKGEGFQLELHASELRPLLRELGALYRLHRREGVPQGRQEFVRLEQNLAQLLLLSEADLQAFLDTHAGDAVLTLHKVLRWLSSSTALADFIAADTGQINLLNALVGIASLRAILRVWEENKENNDEEFWQRTIAQHAFVFSVLFAYPVVIVKGKAYIGGKRLDNLHGHLVDFLARAESSGNALLVEIKTPATQLLGKEYRDGVHPPSRDFGGAVAQILEYRESLMQESHTLNQGESTPLLSTEPRCLVLIGNAAAQLTSEATRRSFERFRERLQGVTVLTFDELFGRVADFEQLLSAPETAPPAPEIMDGATERPKRLYLRSKPRDSS